MLNQLQIQGRLTKDPTVTFGGTSSTKISFTLAVDDNFAKDKTNWIRCSAWGRTAEFMQKWFKKGDMLIGDGHLRTFKPQDSPYEQLEVVIDHVFFTGNKKEKTEEPVEEFIYHEEDLPF